VIVYKRVLLREIGANPLIKEINESRYLIKFNNKDKEGIELNK
jgi:hypothetical protein